LSCKESKKIGINELFLALCLFIFAQGKNEGGVKRTKG
jgi:hypothetical protein